MACVGSQLTSRPDEVLPLVPKQDPRNEVGLRWEHKVFLSSDTGRLTQGGGLKPVHFSFSEL